VSTPAQLVRANGLDVDYVGIGPIFSTATKTDADAPCGCDGLTQMRRDTHHLVVAIGGIHVDNAASVMAAGAHGVAVVSAICSAADPAQAARELRRCLAGAGADTLVLPTRT
jgi:thiamine-phosphate pyrophosphorylase